MKAHLISVKRALCNFITVVSVLVLSGCSETSEDTWYDSSVNANEDKEAYIQFQADLGVDPKEARRNYEREIETLRTEGRDASTIQQHPDSGGNQ